MLHSKVRCHSPLWREMGLPVLAGPGQKEVKQPSHIHGEENDGMSPSTDPLFSET